MQDILSRVRQLNRPRLLVSAARFGVDDYVRNTHLPRCLGTIALPRHGAALMRLLEIEAELNDGRIAHRADYSVARHVEALIAIMGEARLFEAQVRGPGMVADGIVAFPARPLPAV